MHSTIHNSWATLFKLPANKVNYHGKYFLKLHILTLTHCEFKIICIWKEINLLLTNYN